MFDVVANDPDQLLIDRTGFADADVQQISDLMTALGDLREAEARLSAASRRYMKLNETDMRALHFLIVTSLAGELATPGRIAQHLEISTASTTKLLDRLAKGGHVERLPHPTDRRALTVRVTPGTFRAARETVGRQQSRRFYSAARLTGDEREVVIRFLRDMTNELELTGEGWSGDDT